MRSVSNVGLKGETEFFRRRNNRIIHKQKKMRTIKVRSLHLIYIFSILLVIGFVIYKSGKFLLTWEELTVKSFKLINSPQKNPQVMKAILNKYRENILTLSFQDLKDELIKIPEVKDVSLSRALPSTIEIAFILREPVFQLYKKGNYEVYDGDGVLLYKDKRRKKDLITLKHINQKEVRKILPLLSELRDIKTRIEYVSLKKPYGVQLKLKGTPEHFFPGEADFKKKLSQYLRIKNKISLNTKKIKNVDLRFNDRFYIEFAEEVSI
jgi:cell division septal protein FtsQ